MNSKKDFFQKYQLLQNHNIPCMLGFGANGMVQLAIDKNTRNCVAVKKIARRLAFKQSSIHSQLNHQNIVKFIQSFFDHETNSTLMVMQYVSNGTVLNFIDTKETLSVKELCKIFTGVCSAIDFMHKRGIIHRDIKPANILLDQQINPKICDFGNAICQQIANDYCGTYEYLAPEIHCERPYNYKVDIWAAGVLFYELLEKRLPFKSQNKQQLLQQMKLQIKFNQTRSKNFMELIQKMLSFNPLERPQLSKIIQKISKIEKQAQKNPQIIFSEQEQNFLKINVQSQNSTMDDFEIQNNEKITIKKFPSIDISTKIPKLKLQKKNDRCATQFKQAIQTQSSTPMTKRNNWYYLKPTHQKISLKKLLQQKHH